MSKRGDAKSLALDVYQRIRQGIFDGYIKPGTRLQPSVLGKEYSASTTVVREALILLSGDRLVNSQIGVGFSVPELDRNELHDLTLVRCHNETLALTLAIERGGVEWETEVLAAHHRLSRTPRRTPGGEVHGNPDWFNAHRAFHAKLIEACGIPALTDICDKLAAATEIYRVSSGPITTSSARNVEKEHADILAAVLNRNATQAAALLKQHYQATAENLLAHWPNDTEGEAPVTPSSEAPEL
ncbi:GntR family transcriptional regulator [Celeribacter sp. PS-C1]|uniref:GntR family transcriptional regulator n=1 Tax=Celeribacter sp. PS-C1 TaxID=2820813 RepID=UPI001C67C489|nr:GntR family transcriptional regulator [Celeribacter sp. PS-C1]MBW6419754.1 GntR family transcriptional regulator [Celeribacter sp. PS-C1]